MYILIKDSNIEKYPYSVEQLKKDNPNVSFPYNITPELLTEYGVFHVVPTNYPQVDYTKTVMEGTPVRQRTRHEDGTYKADDESTPIDEAWEWVQVWEVSDATAEQVADRIANLNAQAEANRTEAYRTESDPLFFKWQRGEATEQDWLYKVSEIRARYPKI